MCEIFNHIQSYSRRRFNLLTMRALLRMLRWTSFDHFRLDCYLVLNVIAIVSSYLLMILNVLKYAKLMQQKIGSLMMKWNFARRSMDWKMASYVLTFVLEIHVTLPIDSEIINVATWRNATITLEKNDHELKHLFQGNWNSLWLHQVIKIFNNSSEEITKLLCSSSYHDHKYQNVDTLSGRHIIKIIFTR